MKQETPLIKFNKKNLSQITKQKQINYHIFQSSSFTVKKLRPFFIRKKMSDLTYEFDLSNNMKIHSIISVIHLEQIKKNEFEKKNSVVAISDSIIVNEQSE